MAATSTNSAKDYCAICRTHHEFDFPPELLQSIIDGETVLFAGAGISTENAIVFPTTLYEDILEETGHSRQDALSFSQLMTESCNQSGDRGHLVEKVTHRIDYVRSFPGLHRTAVTFHRRLAVIPCIREIITTNWDDFFEIECHATPFVYEQDMVFWDKPHRKVLKLHGSINNLGSLIITSDDYEKRYQSLNTGLVGSQLKLLLAKKRLVFVGYSFNDEDLSRLYTFVSSELGDFKKKAYIITLDSSNDAKWRQMGLIPIYTSGSYFLEGLIHKLQQRGCLIPDTTIRAVLNELKQLTKEHFQLSRSLSIADQPELIYCLSYQDGVTHAFDHFLHHISYGESLCKERLFSIIHGYDGLIKEKRSRRNWYDVAYLQGYQNGHAFALLDRDERGLFPRYLDLSMGREFRTLQEYLGSMSIPDRKRTSMSEYASRVARQFSNGAVVPQHTFFL